MSDNARTIELQVKATNAAGSVLRDVGQDVDRLEHKSEGFFEKYEQGLRRLKQSGGRRGALAETAELFEGKGALVGLTIVGNQIKEASEKLEKFNDELHDSTKSTGEIAEGFAKGLPIIGSWVEAGRTFRGIIDGTAEETRKLNEENKATEGLLEDQSRSLKAMRDSYVDLADASRKYHQEIRQAMLPEGPARTAEAVNFEADSATAEIRKAAEEKIAKLKEENSKAIIEAQQFQARIRNSDGGDTDAGKSIIQGQQDKINNTRAGQENAEKKIRADAEVKASEATQAIALKAERERRAKADEAGVRTREAVERSEKDLRDVRATAAEAQLRESGQGYAAGLAALKATLDERLREIDKAAAEESAHFNPDDTENQGHVQERAQGKADAANDDYKAGVAKAAKDQKKAEADIDERITEGRIKGIEAEVAAGNKARAGEAERLRIAQDFARQKKDLQDLAERANAEQKPRIERQIAELPLQQSMAEGASFTRQDRETDKTLAEAELATLRRRAELGDKVAETEAKKREILEQQVELAKKINDIIADPTVSQAKKDQAKADLDASEAAAQAAILRAGGSRAATATLYTQHTLTGVTGPGGRQTAKEDPFAPHAAALHKKIDDAVASLVKGLVGGLGQGKENPFGYA